MRFGFYRNSGNSNERFATRKRFHVRIIDSYSADRFVSATQSRGSAANNGAIKHLREFIRRANGLKRVMEHTRTTNL